MSDSLVSRLWALLVKEWLTAWNTHSLRLLALLMPLACLILPLLLMADAISLVGSQAGLGSSAQSFLQVYPTLSQLQPAELVQAALANQFMLLFLLAALPLPIMLAAANLSEEQQQRSLEPLLTAPITPAQVLAGKILAAILPGMLGAWLSFGVFLGLARLLAISDAVYSTLFNLTWLLAMLLVVPLLALLGAFLGVLAAARSQHMRAAAQLSVLSALPVLLLVLAQVVGLPAVTVPTMLILVGVVAAGDFWLLFVLWGRFQREALLAA